MKLPVKVSPGARRNEILGWEDYPGTGRVLKLKIAAPPVEGKANKELASFLAECLGLPKSAVDITHGTSGRIKLVSLPDSADLQRLMSR
ncbi:MAG: DUF167 domain-containing protein [Akkermansia sp.]